MVCCWFAAVVFCAEQFGDRAWRSTQAFCAKHFFAALKQQLTGVLVTTRTETRVNTKLDGQKVRLKLAASTIRTLKKYQAEELAKAQKAEVQTA